MCEEKTGPAGPPLCAPLTGEEKMEETRQRAAAPACREKA